MTLVMEQDETLAPLHIDFFGAYTIVSGPNGVTHSLKQPGLWRPGYTGVVLEYRRLSQKIADNGCGYSVQMCTVSMP
jgi:hypothetical protein